MLAVAVIGFVTDTRAGRLSLGFPPHAGQRLRDPRHAQPQPCLPRRLRARKTVATRLERGLGFVEDPARRHGDDRIRPGLPLRGFRSVSSMPASRRHRRSRSLLEVASRCRACIEKAPDALPAGSQETIREPFTKGTSEFRPCRETWRQCSQPLMP